MNEEALAFYRQLENEIQTALQDLTVVPPRKSRPSAVLRQRLEERLQNQREILQRLEAGQIQSEQALQMIVEEQAREATQPGVYGDYLSRLSGHLKKLSGKVPGTEPKAAEGPADD
ncbi:MAG: hypothetical protein AMXMBFR33_15430 [Candidatus Xenobia bacterium]